MKTGIYHRYSPYLETNIQVGIASGKIVKIEFTDQPDPESVENGVDILDDVFEYLSGEETDFKHGTSLTVPTSHRNTLERTTDIPYGETITYGKLAASLGRKDETQEVTQQINDNPIPFIYPTHRVVESHDIGGFTSTRKIKQRLLEIEGGV